MRSHHFIFNTNYAAGTSKWTHTISEFRTSPKLVWELVLCGGTPTSRWLEANGPFQFTYGTGKHLKQTHLLFHLSDTMGFFKWETKGFAMIVINHTFFQWHFKRLMVGFFHLPIDAGRGSHRQIWINHLVTTRYLNEPALMPKYCEYTNITNLVLMLIFTSELESICWLAHWPLRDVMIISKP